MMESEEPNLMEKESTPSSILPNKSVKGLIDELVAGGERSPTRIAHALNGAGFRTQTGTRFERSTGLIRIRVKSSNFRSLII